MRWAIAAMAMAGCATSYQDSYESQRVGRGQHFIRIEANAFTDDGEAYGYFVQRAAELCAADGYASWEMVDRSSGRKYTAVNGQVSSKPHVEGVVRCLEPHPVMRQAPPGPPGMSRP